MKQDNKQVLMGYGDILAYLWISKSYINKEIKKWKIPYQKTSSWRIFYKSDVDKYNETRKEKAKTNPRIKIKN